jgi:hypothetical protein
VGREQREREPVHAEGDAGGVRGLARCGREAEGRREVVAVTVVMHAVGRSAERTGMSNSNFSA